MTFKLNDYVKHVEYPRSKVPLHLYKKQFVDIVNAQTESFEYCTKEEYDRYWEDSE
jgi:hypothetical protein